MTKLLQHRLQVFAASEQSLRLFAFPRAEGMAIAHVPDVVHPVTARCGSFLGKLDIL